MENDPKPVMPWEQSHLGPVRPWDLLNPQQPRSTKELQTERLAICGECELFNSFSQTCSICKCFMRMKTKLEKAYCPIHKW
jgi:hypothetical protein